MQDSDFLLMVRSGDTATLNRMHNYLASGDIMREESLLQSHLPCEPVDIELLNEAFYRVESTGALVTLSSSVALLYFYCSRLPSDGYFKPAPMCEVDKNLQLCMLTFPKSCNLEPIRVNGNVKTLKQLACLEACKRLHQSGALTDNLVPDIVVEEAGAQDMGCKPYVDDQADYFPPELVGHCTNDSARSFHWYLIEIERNFEYNVPLQHIALAVKSELEFDDEKVGFDLEVDKGTLSVWVKHVGVMILSSEQVLLCQRFQITLFRILSDHNLIKLKENLSAFSARKEFTIDYLLVPCSGPSQDPLIIDWKCVSSVLFSCEGVRDTHMRHYTPKSSDRLVHTKNDLVCGCMLENSLVYTPHNGRVYCITGTSDNLDGNSQLSMRSGEAITYKQYYKLRHGIDLCFESESLLEGKPIFPVQNCLQRHRQFKEREPSFTVVKLPPELCVIIMSPISIGTVYSFSFLPSIMHRIECLLIAINLKKMHADQCAQNVVVPTAKVLEAITTRKCQEKFHLESLETLGDSFLKYATCQQLFKTYQNHHEGLLTLKKDKIISNSALCKLGCDHKIPGFIRNEPFDPKMWITPGDRSGQYTLDEEFLSGTRKVFNRGMRKIKGKTVADVVEALIGAFLSTGGEYAALSFMDWLGMKVDFINAPYVRQFPIQPKRHVNIRCLESLLNFIFLDPSLLVEALTHGSYMLPEIPRCYQRLEFLGDSVLDYLITMHMYRKYPGMSPGLLTDLRSASVNNDCYALSTLKAGLHRHILQSSQELHRQIADAVHNFERLSSVKTFGWESETTLPKVLGDVIESLAGAILVDSGYNTDAVFKSIRPLLEPLVTPETLPLNPVRELLELCQREHFVMEKTVNVSGERNLSAVKIEVRANGVVHKHTCSARDKKTANRMASKVVLKSLKERLPERTNKPGLA